MWDRFLHRKPPQQIADSTGAELALPSALLVPFGHQMLIDEFLAALKDSGRASWTVHLYHYQAQQFAAYLVASGKDMRAITSDEIRTYLRQFDSPSTRHAHLAMIRSLFRFLVSRSIVGANPAAAVSYPPRVERPPRVISEPEERTIFAAARGDLEATVLLELLRYSGLRIGGIVGYRRRVYDPYRKVRVPIVTPGLRVGDFDFATGLVQVTLKGGQIRPALLKDHTAAAVRRHIARLPHRSSESPIFQRPDGSPKGDVWAEGVFRELIVGSNLGRRITPHMLRHTFATRYLEEGGDVRSLQRLLHHKRLDSTLIYADFVDPQALRAQFDKFVHQSRKSGGGGVPKDALAPNGAGYAKRPTRPKRA